MKVLLIQPSQKILLGKKKQYGSIMPPLGLLQLSACIKHSCPNTCVDLRDYEIGNGYDDSLYSNYDIIGISGTSSHMPHVFHIISSIREVTDKACIVVGGPHATFAYQNLLETIPELDAVIIGEGELSFINFINSYVNRNSLPETDGIITRKSKTVKLSPVVEDINTLPNLDYDAIDINKYQLSTHRKTLPTPFACLITSRGCPFLCSYCQTPQMFGNHLRYRSPELIFDECKKLRDKFSVKSIVFWDDTFTANRERTLEICQLLKTLGIKWMCNTRVDRVDYDLLNCMKESGCEIIFFGVESFDDISLKDLNRTTSKIEVKNAFNWCRKIRIRTVAALMIGTPNDDLESIENNIKQLQELRPDDVYISIFNVTVGSIEYKNALMAGRIESNINWFDPNKFSGTPYGFPTINSKLNRYQLQQSQKFAYRKFYGKGNEAQYE